MVSAIKSPKSPDSPINTPMKKPDIVLAILVKGKAVSYITRAMAESSCLVLANSRTFQVTYPPINHIWMIFGNNNLTQFLKKVVIHEEYTRFIKYFYDRLILLFDRLDIFEIGTIFYVTLLAWYNLIDSKIPNDMKVYSKSTAHWVNNEMIKKICVYSHV